MAHVCSVASAKMCLYCRIQNCSLLAQMNDESPQESFQWLKGTVTGFMGTGLHSPDKQDAAFKKCEYQ